MRSLFAGIAGLGVLFAVSHYFGSYGAAIAILFALIVAMHVIGNALGTRLRDLGDTPLSSTGSAAQSTSPRRLTTADFAPLTRLRQRISLGKRILILTVLGAVAGGLLGLFGIEWLSGEPAEWPVLAAGTGACAVLGAIWSYAISSFLIVTVGEFLHADRNSQPR
jgi:hypothetical protein